MQAPKTYVPLLQYIHDRTYPYCGYLYCGCAGFFTVNYEAESISQSLSKGNVARPGRTAIGADG